MPWPVPTVEELSLFTGRPVVSYTGYVNSACLQAAVMFTIITERGADEYGTLAPDDQLLANLGVMAMADYIYLRWPYQQVLASPLQNETIGSYSYSKPIQEMARNAQALEVTSDKTGITMFDLAVQMLAKRTRANGVFSGSITGFEHFARDDQARIMWDKHEQRMVLTGPADRDQVDMQFFSISAETFAADPG